MEFSVQLARVEVLEELQHPPRLVAVLVLGEQVHVAERVNRDQWQVARRLAQVVQRVRELFTISGQEIDIFYNNQIFNLDLIQNEIFLLSKIQRRDTQNKIFITKLLLGNSM